MNIRTFRTAKGLTLAELADAIDVSKGYLSVIERAGGCSPAVALKLEAYWKGDLDAAALSPAVAAARAQPAAA
jgi:transcriptional regulator with XRE-family HTH domain